MNGKFSEEVPRPRVGLADHLHHMGGIRKLGRNLDSEKVEDSRTGDRVERANRELRLGENTWEPSFVENNDLSLTKTRILLAPKRLSTEI